MHMHIYRGDSNAFEYIKIISTFSILVFTVYVIGTIKVPGII